MLAVKDFTGHHRSCPTPKNTRTHNRATPHVTHGHGSSLKARALLQQHSLEITPKQRGGTVSSGVVFSTLQRHETAPLSHYNLLKNT